MLSVMFCFVKINATELQKGKTAVYKLRSMIL